MSTVKLTILGCGSALPAINAFHSAQLLEMRGKVFMIDCGEGTQIRLRQYRLSTTRMNHIFISHLHGDHSLGLPGLLSTLGMTGRTAPLTIHAHPDLERIIGVTINYFCQDSPFEIRYEAIDPYRHAVIYEDNSLTVTSLPLKHRVPTCGFLFEEKALERHLIRSMIDAYSIPVHNLKAIKNGADYTTPEGEIVANHRLTTPPTPPKRYAYCSDTACYSKLIPLIDGVDCLYHEATFLECDMARAKETFHSSARQAADIAAQAHVKQLIIGHYSARYHDITLFEQEARAVFPATTAAKDGAVFEF
jgi:ribonuclease Z